MLIRKILKILLLIILVFFQVIFYIFLNDTIEKEGFLVFLLDYGYVFIVYVLFNLLTIIYHAVSLSFIIRYTRNKKRGLRKKMIVIKNYLWASPLVFGLGLLGVVLFSLFAISNEEFSFVVALGVLLLLGLWNIIDVWRMSVLYKKVNSELDYSRVDEIGL